MKILVFGAGGQIGSELIKKLAHKTYQIIPVTRKEFDCIHHAHLDLFLEAHQPDLIINAAAYTAVDKAEDEAELAQQINTRFVLALADFCKASNLPLIHLSTDYVFDGAQVGPYYETDEPNPQGVYAKTKWAGEEAIKATLNQYLILRVSWVFGKVGTNFVKTILSLALTKEELRIVSDQWGNPTAASDIARVLLELVQKIENPSFKHWGLYHYSGAGTTNWYEFAQAIFAQLKQYSVPLRLIRLTPIQSEEYPSKVLRPKNSVLSTEKIQKVLGIQPRSWQDELPQVLEQFIKENLKHEID